MTGNAGGRRRLVESDAQEYNLSMTGKDDPAVQKTRVISLAKEVFPDFEIVFDDGQPPSWLRFRIDEPKMGTIISQPSGNYHASEIADWFDDRLKKFLASMAPSFRRPMNS
jgi:hypothetical protein